MIRKSCLLLALVALVTALPAVAEEMTLDQVLAKHYDALGGLDKIKGLKSARFTGTMTVGPGAEAPFTMTFKRPQHMRLEFTLQGMTGIQAYDGQTAWMVMPFMGKTNPELMTEDQKKNLEEQADLDGPLVDWKEKGHQVELAGKEEVEGTPAYRINVTLKNGDSRVYFLDADYFVVIKQEGKTEVQGNPVEFETTLSDYKEAGGILFPHSIENRQKGAPQGQVITIKQIEVDPEVSDDLFTMPPKVEEKPAQ